MPEWVRTACLRRAARCGAAAMLAAGVLLTADAQAGLAAGTPQPVTFAKEIAPLLAEHCGACHQPGGAAPFSVLTWEEVRPWARAIRQAVRTRSMPPWKPEPGYGGPFLAERRLGDAAEPRHAVSHGLQKERRRVAEID